MTQLLERRLIQKEEHEHKRQKRHDDRLQLESKLIDSLTQFLNSNNNELNTDNSAKRKRED